MALDSSSSAEKIATDSPPAKKQQDPAPNETHIAPYSSFTPRDKKLIVLGASATGFFSPFAAQIYLPALTPIAKDLHVTNSQINLTITTYMIFQGICPMFVGSLADTGGRRPAYTFCFTTFIAACVGLALAPNYAAVLVLRALQSAGSSSTVALCTAVVADIVTSAERGQYVSFTIIGTVLAPTLGPVLGGVLSQHLGWRSIFWFLVILAGIALILVLLFFPETCRHVVGDGSVRPPAMYLSGWQAIKRRKKETENSKADASKRIAFKFKPPNVLGSLAMLMERETGLLLFTSSIIFAGFYSLAAAMPSQLRHHYHLDETKVGLMYLPLALGCIAAAFIVGPMINRSYKRYCDKTGFAYDRTRQTDLSTFPIERARLEVGFPLMILAACALVAWGWAMQAKAHIAVICVLNVIIGMGLIGFSNTNNVLLVDLHPGKAGAAVAANNLTRCLLGAGATAAIVPMIRGIGIGWAFTIIGGLYFVCIPPLILIIVRGMKWRAALKEKREQLKLKKEAVSS